MVLENVRHNSGQLRIKCLKRQLHICGVKRVRQFALL